MRQSNHGNESQGGIIEYRDINLENVSVRGDSEEFDHENDINIMSPMHMINQIDAQQPRQENH